MGSISGGVRGCGTVEGEGMRLCLIVCLAVPLVVCAAVCDCIEWVFRRVRG